MGKFPQVLPVALLLSGRRCLVVGGGDVAARKAAALVNAGADVTVVAPTTRPTMASLVDSSRAVAWRRGHFSPADLDDVDLVCTATGIPKVDHLVAEEATARRLFVNSADDPSACTFFLTAVVRRDPVVVAISTAGASPALATYLRRRLERELEGVLGDVAVMVADARAGLHAQGRSTESVDWSKVVDDALIRAVSDGDLDVARHRLDKALR